MEEQKLADFRNRMARTKELLSGIRAAREREPEHLEEQVKRYIRLRYMLDRLPETGESVYDLAEESLAIMSRMDSAQLHAMEDISGCTSAKSAMVKKVLLLMSLKNGLDLQLTEDDCLDIVTVGDVVAAVRNS